MDYPEPLEGLQDRINRFARHKSEMGAVGINEKLLGIRKFLEQRAAELEAMPEGPRRAAEPDTMAGIISAAPQTKTPLDFDLTQDEYLSKLRGAVIGRFAGCALGAPVELLTLEQLQSFAADTGTSFPPQNYWMDAPVGYFPRYKAGKGRDFALPNMKALPPDDDIAYTFLALLVLEEFGAEFTTSDIAAFWQKYLPLECTFTAERITLRNLREGLPVERAGVLHNPDVELIGASIRCDGWAYVNPGIPARAAEFAWRDAVLSHRKSGIYSAMYFAAVIAAAFVSDSLEQALAIGLEYIPAECEFSRQIHWALEKASEITDYSLAHAAVSERFAGMDPVNAVNNACLTVWGILLGKDEYTAGISETVAMGYDNDCTAATAGSVLGAFHGIDRIPAYWYEPWNNTAVSYLNGIDSFGISEVIERFFDIWKSIS